MDIVAKMDRFQILQNVLNVKYTLGIGRYEMLVIFINPIQIFNNLIVILVFLKNPIVI